MRPELAEKYGATLKDQVDLYRPHMIIGCGVGKTSPARLLLPLLGDGREKQRTVTLDKCRERLAALESQRADLDATIDELNSFCRLLEELKSGLSLDEARRKHNAKLRSVAE